MGRVSRRSISDSLPGGFGFGFTMAEEKDYYAELALINGQLRDISSEIDDLLTQQTRLNERRTQLETIIHDNENADQVRDTKKQWNTKDFAWSEDLERYQKTVFRVDSLRPMQLETMNVTMSGKDCILIMPTGGGKSLCFQLPAVASKGITLVVSPLVSLMEDQLFSLKRFNVSATLLNASCSKEKVNATQAAMLDRNSDLKLLYVTPEKLAKSKRFMAKLEKMYAMGRFSRLVIDAVHYRFMAKLVKP